MFVVTGGGSGIGRALAHRLATQGKQVLIIGRREEQLVETADFSPLISFLCSDVSTHEGRLKIAHALQHAISLEGLVHNAGVIEPIAPLANIDEALWQQAFATNLNAPLLLTQLLLGKLKHGRVLTIGTAAAYFPVVGWAAYCASKAALAMLIRCWQLESRNTAFASVMPGIVDTEMQRIIRYAAFMDEDKKNFFKQLKTGNGLLTPETVGLFLSWLLLETDDAQFSAQEWDIYDKSHHEAWLVAPYEVPEIE